MKKKKHRKNMQHKELAAGRWQKLSLIERMANVGSEVSPAIAWRKKGSQDSQLAFERALELLNFTIFNQLTRNGTIIF